MFNNLYHDYNEVVCPICGGKIKHPYTGSVSIEQLEEDSNCCLWGEVIDEGGSTVGVSNSLRPHGLQPTRLLCPWNSPGKNPKVGSLSLLQGNLPHPEIEPGSPALQADSLLSEPPGKFPDQGSNLGS